MIGGKLTNVEFTDTSLVASILTIEQEDSIIQTQGLLSSNGRLNFRLKPVGPDISKTGNSTEEQEELIVSTPTYFRFYYNDRTFENPSHSEVPIDNGSLINRTDDLFAIRIANDNRPEISTKMVTQNINWPDNYPSFLDIEDKYKFKINKQRVSAVLRSSEILFELPNNLNYNSDYSNFVIKDLNLDIHKKFIARSSTTFEGNLTANGLTSINNSLDIKGATIISNDLTVTGSGTVNTDFSVDGTSTLSGTVTTNSSTTINSGLTVTGSASVNTDFSVDGTSTFNGNTTVDDIFTVNNYVTTLNGPTTINNSLTVKGDLNVVNLNTTTESQLEIEDTIIVLGKNNIDSNKHIGVLFTNDNSVNNKLLHYAGNSFVLSDVGNFSGGDSTDLSYKTDNLRLNNLVMEGDLNVVGVIDNNSSGIENTGSLSEFLK